MMHESERLLNEKYHGQKNEAWLADCARLEAGEPLAYVIGWVPFLDCKIWLDSHPLIPRPETEFWLEQAIMRIEHRQLEAPRILDLCAGSGCIGVAVAKALPHAQVDFVELDPAHHTTIEKSVRENCSVEDLPATRYIFGGDVFAEIPADTKYDYILSNPPYIDPALDRTEASVRDYEPDLALYGGQAGLECIARIIREASAYLTPHGELWLEHEPEQSKTLAALAAAAGFIVTTSQDQYQVERFSQLVLQ